MQFEDEQWTWAEHVQISADRAAWLQSIRRDGPFHVGVLMDNVPEFSFLLGAAAFSGAVIVGLNPTRRGAELARRHRAHRLPAPRHRAEVRPRTRGTG